MNKIVVGIFVVLVAIVLALSVTVRDTEAGKGWGRNCYAAWCGPGDRW